MHRKLQHTRTNSIIFDEIFDLTAGVECSFIFYHIIIILPVYSSNCMKVRARVSSLSLVFPHPREEKNRNKRKHVDQGYGGRGLLHC